MKILFLCTAHNSFSQHLYIILSRCHEVTIEYAISDEVMLEAVALSEPDLVICPFLTAIIPKPIYENVVCLIIHPGPPGDIGPSSLDWLLFGDDGIVEDPAELLKRMDNGENFQGRTHWAVTVLQAAEQLDAGPVWAFQQFQMPSIDQPRLTKSSLYRGIITTIAVSATMKAVERVQFAFSAESSARTTSGSRKERLSACPDYARLSVIDKLPFQGGPTRARPLFKASYATFDVSRHTAQYISRRIRCADAQPGVCSDVFGPKLYLYGGMIDDTMSEVVPTCFASSRAGILAIRDGAVCIAAAGGKGVWITHVRKPKTASDKALWPKVPAVEALKQLHILDITCANRLHSAPPTDFSLLPGVTLQEVWIDFKVDGYAITTAFLHFEHYNGAMSTDQCSRLIEAMEFILRKAALDQSIRALVLMGGPYFSNGIALNVIEAASDPGYESWLNINRIDDVVHYILHEFPSANITTIAAIRGNAAAGGVALAAACDFVIARYDAVLNPAYRSLGLYGSEFHTLSYYSRCGQIEATRLLHAMTPIGAVQAQQIGLVDIIVGSRGDNMDREIRAHVSALLADGASRQGAWKRDTDLSLSSLARTRAFELAEMTKDIWSARAIQYHSRRHDFVRKVKPTKTPLHFAQHRRNVFERAGEETVESGDTPRCASPTRSSFATKLPAVIMTTTAPGATARTVRLDSGWDGTPSSLPCDSHLAPPTNEQKTETLFACHYGIDHIG